MMLRDLVPVVLALASVGCAWSFFTDAIRHREQRSVNLWFGAIALFVCLACVWMFAAGSAR